MIINRRYQPDAAALDELVEALYRLILETPEDPAPIPAEDAPLSPGSALLSN